MARQVIELVRDQFGVPEIAVEYRSVPNDTLPLSSDEFAYAIDLHLGLIKRTFVDFPLWRKMLTVSIVDPQPQDATPATRSRVGS